PLAEPADDAVKVARRVALEADSDLLAQQLLKRHLALGLAVHPDLEVERPGDLLRAGEGVEEQHVLAQGGRDRHEAAVLRVRRHAALLLVDSLPPWPDPKWPAHKRKRSFAPASSAYPTSCREARKGMPRAVSHTRRPKPHNHHCRNRLTATRP